MVIVIKISRNVVVFAVALIQQVESSEKHSLAAKLVRRSMAVKGVNLFLRVYVTRIG